MIKALFQQTFDRAPDVTEFTPGRVNLIGEHTDYNGGWVLPTALTLGVSLAASPREEVRLQMRSYKFDARSIRPVNDPANGQWSDYIVGA